MPGRGRDAPSHREGAWEGLLPAGYRAATKLLPTQQKEPPGKNVSMHGPSQCAQQAQDEGREHLQGPVKLSLPTYFSQQK